MRLRPSERKALLLFIDTLLVNGALLAALTGLSKLSPEHIWHVASLRWYVLLTLVWLLMAAVFGVYNLTRAASSTTAAIFAGTAALATALAYQAIPTLTPPPTRRVFVFGFTAMITASITLWRVFYARVLNQASFQRRVLVVGQGPTVRAQAEALGQVVDGKRASPFQNTGYQVVGIVEDMPDVIGLDRAHLFVQMIRSQGIDEVLLASDGASGAFSNTLREALLDCRELSIPVTSLLSAYERLTNRLPVTYAARDLRLIMGQPDTPTDRFYNASKRATDIVVALVGALIMGTLIPFIALANALSSPGPLFYRQQRVGRGGRPFAVIKFRTMCLNAEADAAVWSARGDRRVTAAGRLLRRFRIDELPQVMNVLRGEMSIVGPRPERPQFVGEISRAIPIYRARHAVRPGITGLAQIRYHYGNSVEDARVKLEYDLYYVKHANLALDLMIMLQTPLEMLTQQGS